MIYVAETDSILTYLGAFKYWPEVIAVLGSVAVAWFTAWRTSRSEILKSFRAKRMETYEEILSLFAKLVQDAQIIFSDEFSAKAATIELKVKTYGSKQVMVEFSKALDELEGRRAGYCEREADLESKYMPTEPVYDDEGALLDYQTHSMVDYSAYEGMLEKEKADRTPSICELDSLFQPTIDAIRRSGLKAKD